MIQKITPKKFVSDKDERLVTPNEMILAENVTISERADGSASILKTMKGTSEISKKTGEIDAPDTWKVVGSCSDDQRGRVYFFLYDTADLTDHRIMMFDKSTDKWETVFKDDYLNFNENYPVKADVLNKAFNQDGVVQTVLYFTDNNNPPRKINVDRALAGEYATIEIDGVTQSATLVDLDYALNTIKAPPKSAPKFVFEKDTDVNTNNFKSDSFQFSCQYIYRDGEESALSSYSNLAISPYLSNRGLTEFDEAVLDGNVCVVTIPWDANFDEKYIDVSAVRLLGRTGNSGSFFILDEFDPKEDLTRDVAGSSTLIYDSGTKAYRFYNDGYYSVVSSITSGKLYDNVPQKAQGQAIAGSRLMYSNYTEGYENFDVAPDVTLTVAYGDEATIGGSYVNNVNNIVKYPDSTSYPTTEAGAKDYGIVVIDLLDSLGVSWPGSVTSLSDTLPDGVSISIEFKFDPEGHYYASSGQSRRFLKLEGTYQTTGAGTGPGGTYDLSFGASNNSRLDIPSGKSATFRVEYTTSGSDTVQDVYDALESLIDEEGSTVRVPMSINADMEFENVTATDGLSPPISNGDTRNISGDIYAYIGFDFAANTEVVGEGLAIYPYVKQIRPRGSGITINLSGVAPADDTVITSTFSTFTNPSTQLIIQNANDNPAGYILSRSASIGSTNIIPTFKHGSTHDFGIVYFDKWGRSGFVNEIGSVYVEAPCERTGSGNKGNANVEVTFAGGLDDSIPEWADTFQMVYGGSQFSNVFQYTTGGGYFVQENNVYTTSTSSTYSDNDLVLSDHRIFVSLNTLEQHQRDSGSAREYSFTKGDILRVISYKNTAGQRLYPAADSGGIIEFEIMGVEFLEEAAAGYEDGVGNPIQWNLPTPATQGKFLVLRAPRVDAGEDKYEGFDWYSLVAASPTASELYPDGSSPTAANRWGAETVVEILTPKKISDTTIYYEIGDRTRIGIRKDTAIPSDHGPKIVLSNGDVMFRSVSCRTPVEVGGSYNVAALSYWEDKLIALECEQPSDAYEEKAWSQGRAHTTFERAATINRYNGITYSQAYADDTNVLSLSSFVPSQANFFDLPSEGGACNFIGIQGDNLMAIQENKVSRLSINKSVLETGTQSGVVALSNKVINNIVAYAGDFGTSNPESVLIRDGISYFVDAERRSIVRISNNGLEVISDKDVKSKIADRIAAAPAATRIVSGYDAEDDIYYATLLPLNNFSGYTIGYDEKGGFWQGNYTFYADRYATLKDSFYGFKSGNGSIMHEFDDTNPSNRFFDSSASPVASKVRVVSNANPSMVKKYQAISVESKVQWSAKLFDSDGRESKEVSFSEREDAFYGRVEGIKTYIAADTNSKRKTNDVRYLPVGTVQSATNSGTNNTGRTDIVLKNNLRGMHIPIGYELHYLTASGQIDKAPSDPSDHSGVTPKVVEVDRANNTISVEPAFDLDPLTGPSQSEPPPEDTKLFVAHSLDGLTSEGIRDHYSVIELSYTPDVSDINNYDPDGEELYAINAYFKNSPLNHAIG